MSDDHDFDDTVKESLCRDCKMVRACSAANSFRDCSAFMDAIAQEAKDAEEERREEEGGLVPQTGLPSPEDEARGEVVVTGAIEALVLKRIAEKLRSSGRIGLAAILEEDIPRILAEIEGQ